MRKGGGVAAYVLVQGEIKNLINCLSKCDFIGFHDKICTSTLD